MGVPPGIRKSSAFLTTFVRSSEPRLFQPESFQEAVTCIEIGQKPTISRGIAGLSGRVCCGHSYGIMVNSGSKTQVEALEREIGDRRLQMTGRAKPLAEDHISLTI